MSGIFGLFNQDRAPARREEMASMASLLKRRGPDRTGIWHQGAVGLGHTLLTTTPESVFEQVPLIHPESGCVAVADVRLDNRSELLAGLRISERAPKIGDVAIILLAYLAWGKACVERLLGDFAFAIWDPGRRKLFCARDHLGMRPFYYHHTPGRFFAFASEPRAILVLPQAPYRINEVRIADFLVSQLEGIDNTSTFFEEVYRLPPAHTLALTPDGMELRRYWRLEPGPELRLSTDEAYAEAFLEVLAQAVHCRLRSAGPVGSMLSGGLDSSSVVAVARELLAAEGRGPLPTFSAVGPDPENCVETRIIHAALKMDGIEPHLVSHDQLGALMPELLELTWALDEPFDNHMTLVRALYLAAHRTGAKVVLDGVGGDVVLGEGSHLTRLLRRGRLVKAYCEAVGQNRFWGGDYPAWLELYRSARSILAPEWAWRLVRQGRADQEYRQCVRESMINPDFAVRSGLADRLRTMSRSRPTGLSIPYGQERALSVDQPYLTVARERYGREAASVATEPRDPFLDRRLIAFCLQLPGEQRIDGGWPKVILRRTMAGKLPDAVRWRPGKEHLGWTFTLALMNSIAPRIRGTLNESWRTIAPFVDLNAVRVACRPNRSFDDLPQAETIYEIALLAIWLDRHAERPKPQS